MHFFIPKLPAISLVVGLTLSSPIQSMAELALYQPTKPSAKLMDGPARPLTDVLKELKQRFGVDILYGDQIVRGLTVPIEAVNQQAGLEESLKQALKDTGLQFRRAKTGAYVISGQPIDRKPSASTKAIPDVVPVRQQAPIESTPRAVDQVVSGRVTDENGAGLPGANIVLKGTTRGASTDVDGQYRLSIPENGENVLVFSLVGYTPQEITVGSRTTLDVKLLPDNKTLEEVVVVGYGTQKKADVTGAIASVNANTIARAATPNAVGALQGQVPGVVITRNVGKPGGSFSINIRGISSIGGSNDPLIVIDGIPSTAGLNDLNPADIEKIDVLKDASATAIYGSRGAKGVVIVTTKRGKSGKTTISYDAYVGARVPTNLPRMFTGPEYVDFRTEMFRGLGRSTDRNNAAFFTPDQWKNIDEGRFTDWPSLVLKNGLQMSHNITASGGDDKTRFAMSAGLLQEDGNVSPENFKRYTLRGNVDRQINEKWKAGLSFYLAQNLQNLGSSEALRSAYRLPPVTYPY